MVVAVRVEENRGEERATAAKPRAQHSVQQPPLTATETLRLRHLPELGLDGGLGVVVEQRGGIGHELGYVRAREELVQAADLDGQGALDVVREEVRGGADDLDDVGPFRLIGCGLWVVGCGICGEEGGRREKGDR
jgi:hypothetical protein